MLMEHRRAHAFAIAARSMLHEVVERLGDNEPLNSSERNTMLRVLTFVQRDIEEAADLLRAGPTEVRELVVEKKERS